MKLTAQRPCAGGKPRRHVCEKPVDIDVLATDRERTLVGTRYQEQVFGEANETVRLLGCGSERIRELFPRTGPPKRQLELGLQQGKRGAQLVARIRHEPPFVLDGGAEPREHVVERDGEPADLVAARRHRQDGRLVGGHGLRPPAQDLDRTQSARCECVSAKGGSEQRERQKDEKLVPKVGKRVAARGERARNHGDRPPTRGEGEHTPLASTAGKLDLLVRPDVPRAGCEHDSTIEHRRKPWRLRTE
jgi:hypothetical protein